MQQQYLGKIIAINPFLLVLAEKCVTEGDSCVTKNQVCGPEKKCICKGPEFTENNDGDCEKAGRRNCLPWTNFINRLQTAHFNISWLLKKLFFDLMDFNVKIQLFQEILDPFLTKICVYQSVRANQSSISVKYAPKDCKKQD